MATDENGRAEGLLEQIQRKKTERAGITPPSLAGARRDDLLAQVQRSRTDIRAFWETPGVTATPPKGATPTEVAWWSWTEKSALECLRQDIRDWRAKQYNFAADLLQHFIDKKGPAVYGPTEDNRTEVIEHGLAEMGVLIEQRVREVVGDSALGMHDIEIKYPGVFAPSNITYEMGKNDHMFYAYHGARFGAKGKIQVDGRRDDNEFSWSGDFTAVLGDYYTFASRWAGLRYPSYDAAGFLEQKCGYKAFAHELRVPLSFADVRTRTR